MCCDRYDAVRIAGNVHGFTGLWAGCEVKGIVHVEGSHWHDMGSAVPIDGCQPSSVPIWSSRFRSLRDSFLQALLHLLPWNYGCAITVEVLLGNWFFQLR